MRLWLNLKLEGENKMKETKAILLADLKNAESKIENLNTNDNHEKWLLERDRIRNELIKLEQIESENKRERNRNIINCVTFGVSFLGGLWAVLASFEFDTDRTLTSTNGRNIVTNFVSKTLMFKR